jgi:hypothetical protein
VGEGIKITFLTRVCLPRIGGLTAAAQNNICVSWPNGFVKYGDTNVIVEGHTDTSV